MTSDSDTAAIDTAALHQKYLAERDKRLRPDGLAQYVSIDGEFADYGADPNVPGRAERAPVAEEVDVAVIGGGTAGLLTSVRLREGGVTSLRIIEKGADFGGVWYWNRYPGVRCDVESYIYMPLLEETGYIPTEKYAAGREIFEHLRSIGRQWDLYDDALFQTAVRTIDWDQDRSRWVLRTDRGDEIAARFLSLGCGPFTKPKLPGIPGLAGFGGAAFHTSRWDYGYTGGDAAGGMEKLADKTVAVIGTGASGIQAIPMLARDAKRLLVFQRTPSAVDVRDNYPTAPDFGHDFEPGWQKRRMENFTAILLGIPQSEDLVADRWTDVWSKLLVQSSGAGDAVIDRAAAMQLVDYQKMEEIRARVDSVVRDRGTAEALKPWYNLFCKRPLYSDQFLASFNQRNVTLIDTDGRGVERITRDAVVANGEAYPVDCIVFATGFEASAPVYDAGGFTLTGRDGLSLNQEWSGGVRSLHGMYSRGFPNLFIVGSRSQASTTINVPHMHSEQATHVAEIITRCLKDGVRTIEVSEAAELAWQGAMAAKKVDRSTFEEECTPGYFNNEGAKDRPTLFGSTYGGGPIEFIGIIRDWRESGLKEDMEITYVKAGARDAS